MASPFGGFQLSHLTISCLSIILADSMDQNALINVDSCQNTKYLKTSGGQISNLHLNDINLLQASSLAVYEDGSYSV